MIDENADDENPPLAWSRNNQTSNVREGLFVTDAELIRRLGVGERAGRIALLGLDKAGGFPKKDPLFGNKRYWPAVRKFLDNRYIHKTSPINPRVVRWRENFDGPETVPQKPQADAANTTARKVIASHHDRCGASQRSRSATSREVAGRKRYFRLSCGWLVAVAVLAISPMAYADPIHMACSGGMLLPNSKVDTNSVLSLTIDLRWDSDSRGYQPVGILPAFPAMPKSGIQDTENNEVSFIGSTIQGVLSGSVDRVTGEAKITFNVLTPQERFFSGICRPAQKLF
jgi:hypothetical protein